jgi:hypothetical protein
MTNTNTAAATRCTHATYEAITGTAWTGDTLVTGACLLQALRSAGWSFNPCDDRDDIKTVRQLANNTPAGAWYIHTSGHAMAMVDGILTDTEGRGFDGRRIEGMSRMVKVA